MSDFHQTGVITSLHRLGKSDVARLEAELLGYSDERPLALVLPSLFSETRGPALKGIVEELAQVPYLRQCVVSLSGAADLDQFREMRELFRPVRCLAGNGPTVIWNDGPRLRELMTQLWDEGLDPGPSGKGLATWMAYGYVLATHRARVIALPKKEVFLVERQPAIDQCVEGHALFNAKLEVAEKSSFS